MASARKVPEKRHHPVESICRKIRAIQRREAISNPIRQIIKYQSSSFDSPQTNSKKNFEEVLRKLTTAHIPMPDSHLLSSQKADTFTSSPQMISSGTPSIAHLSPPEPETYSVFLTSSENISMLRSERNKNYTSLMSQIRKGEFSNKDSNNYCSGNNFSTITLDFDSNFCRSSECFDPQDSVVKKLSLNGDGWKQGADDGKDITDSTNRVREEEVLASIFYACDTKHKGSVRVAKIMDYLRQTHSQDSEDSGLEELWNVLDPEKRDPHVDLETFQALMKEWMVYCRNKWFILAKRQSRNRLPNLAKHWDKISNIGKEPRDTVKHTVQTLNGELSDLITYVAELHFNKQKLEEENNKFKLALETLEETNSQLSEDCAALRLQIKREGMNSRLSSSIGDSVFEQQDSIQSSGAIKMTTGRTDSTSGSFKALGGDMSRGVFAHQAIMRTNLLKEELEELKLSVNASEEQKAVTVAQNKQLETENRALILKIRILQEENIKNIMDIDRLEKTIEELSKTETEHQKDLSIEELKSTIIECRSVIENLRGDKNKLVQELQHLQQELIINGIQLNVSGERNSIISGEKSLHYELILAQSAEDKETEWQCSLISLSSLDMMMDQEMLLLPGESEQRGVEFTAMLQKLHEEVSEVETLNERFLRWVINPEITMKEKWERQLTEFKHTVEEKLNLCILTLDSLENHKESLDKEFAKLMEILKRLSLDYFYFRKEFLSSRKQLEAIKQLQEDAVNQEAILRKRLQEASQRLADAEEQVKDRHQAAHSAREKAASLLQKLEEAISEQWNLQTINTELSKACQTLEQKTRKLKTTVESLRKKLIEGGLHGLLFQKQCCHKLYGGQEARIHQTPLTLKHTCWYTPLLDALSLDSLTAIPRLEVTPFSCVANRIHASCGKPQYEEIKDGALNVTRQHKCPGPTGGPHPGTDLSGCIRMNDELRMEVFAPLKNPGTSPAHENIASQDSMNKDKTVLTMEAKEEPKTIEEHKKECASGDTAVSPLPVTTVKSVNFRQSDNTSANEKEVEAEFLRLSLGFKCDWFTLEKRVKLEERSRDLAEDNLKKEITNCLKLLEESRVSKAVEVMIQHVENLKRMYAKEHAELEELKQVLLQNERSFNPLEDEALMSFFTGRFFQKSVDAAPIQEGDTWISLEHILWPFTRLQHNGPPPPSSLRRVTIASLPRNIGNVGMVAGMENNDQFSRRSSSWRILGSKQSEHRPSLHRFISTYSWADAEEEKCELNSQNGKVRDLKLEKTVEFANYDTIASWATHLKTSIRKANKALWLSLALIVLFAALMSFFTGRFFQKSVDAAPIQEGDTWISLEHILWPFTRLQHNGPPPV
ncbi:PREDICTED: lymphoid-restricted membrane protein-like [Propithecus coquereli]|uniref:lymphoid-restricted membrane protein-like n=1 Tax=Propithecus coquereli TaxID=379532 RepID=UPI00063F9BE2|nr:PREDICTED: lymphoid-restricted membrane protein-like [Propithecus coquereli]